MKNFLFIIYLVFASGSAVCQTDSEQFSKFISALGYLDIPLVSSDVSKSAAFNETARSLSANEWLYFGVDKNTWPIHKDYSYEAIGKFMVKRGFVGVIYRCSYEPIDIVKEKHELILVVYKKNGALVSWISIQGNHDDELHFFGNINKYNEIIINYEYFNINAKNKKSKVVRKTKKYVIDKDGKIVDVGVKM
ncbi:hypothetical protein LJY25_17265 [Hymenobacter sp. BT175]|uniref:hypothetical protein n=1 Tax=Hymenobacter translucens TaxID=2886507 RepID=UPI001D0E1321|nr:hypothetical protein [Hymenobacter translucens]MCC2548203.1 hypothetical protein [Hymenobacter translucens]